MTRPPLYPRRRKARCESACGRCGALILVGAMIFKWPDERWWRCQPCASFRARTDAARDREAACWQLDAEGRL